MSRITSPFAFLGRSKAASDDKDEDDKNKSKSKAEDGDDEDDKKDKDKKDDDAKGKKNAKAEDKDDDKKDKDDEDDDKSKSSKSKASDDEDDDQSDTSAKKARARERGRIRAILTSPAGQADPVGAAHLALDTAMPRADAVAMLTAMQLGRDAMAASGGAPRAGLGERMGGVSNPAVGADAGSSGAPTMAERMIAADRRRRGES